MDTETQKKGILFVGNHDNELKKEVESMFKGKFSLIFAETTECGRDKIEKEPLNIHVTSVNVSSVSAHGDKETIKALDYISDVSLLVRDSLENSIPVIITCSDPGNSIAQTFDKVIDNKNILVTGKIVLENLTELIEKSLSTTSFEKPSSEDIASGKKEDSNAEQTSSLR